MEADRVNRLSRLSLARADVVAAATLAAAGAVIAWPVLTGGYLTYLDNPAHLAEVGAAAFEAFNGWSETAFCGFPVSTLHSPLWYGVLSAFTRAGVSPFTLYALFVWLGFVAPPLALYSVARKALTPSVAAVLAFVLLLQRPAIVGIGSAPGGMWTFYIAAAALVVLIDRLARPCRSMRDAAAIASLVGFIVVTHLYAVVPLALIAVIHAWTVMGKRKGGEHGLAPQALAAAAGIPAAAVYWAPLLMARGTSWFEPQNLAGAMVMARLAVPTHALDLVQGHTAGISPGLIAGALPMLALLTAGVAGIAFLGRRRDDAPLYGALTAAVLLTLLVFVTGEFDVKLLGPGSWRMLYFVRLGLALAAIPYLARVSTWPVFRVRFPVWMLPLPVAVALMIAFQAGAPLRAAVPDPAGNEMDEVRALWKWLEENRQEDWGRVYVQDTFEKPRAGVELSQSHVLALTARETGVRQLGATYGVVPYLTARWTPSEFGTLFRGTVRDTGDVVRVVDWMRLANATHVVTSDTSTARTLAVSGQFEDLFAVGRFNVLRAAAIGSEWVAAEGPGVETLWARFETGRYAMRLRGDGSGSVLVRSSYHPFWRFAGPDRIGVNVEDTGLMRLVDLPPGETEVTMTFLPPAWPLLLSAGSWFVIAAVWVFAGPGRKRRKA